MYTFTAQSELMENYLPERWVLPDRRFVALQTDLGAALLFSVSSEQALTLTVEFPGSTESWRQVDLGAARNAQDFQGRAKVKTFAAAQTFGFVERSQGVVHRIHLAMVLNDGENDHLYLSLGNSDSDLAWVENVRWTPAAFNASSADNRVMPRPDPLLIEDVILADAADAEFVVVYTPRGRTKSLLTRYIVDVSQRDRPQWRLHNVPIDLQGGNHASCLGRAKTRGAQVDGIYEAGVVKDKSQFVYAPLFNVYDPRTPAPVARLRLPDDSVVEAMAAARNRDNTSDLFVTAKESLYWFACDNQRDGAIGKLIAHSPLLSGVRDLFAAVSDDHVTVWGLNSGGAVFYLSCALGQQGLVSSWNEPIPIVSGVDAISPYINRGFSANTFFAHSAGALVRLVKSPITGLWNQQYVSVPAAVPTSANTSRTQPIHSYSTHIQVLDATGQPAPNVEVKLTASNVIPVYINHRYYVLGPTPVGVGTDARGCLAIVERTESLVGTRFDVAVGSECKHVNTMDTAWRRNAAFTTADQLAEARIYSRDGSCRNFIPSGTSRDELLRVAAANQALAMAYEGLLDRQTSAMKVKELPLATCAQREPSLGAQGWSVGGNQVDLGDLVRWLDVGVDAAVELVKGVAEDVWRLVLTIGDRAYHATLDCVESVLAAASWVYGTIKIAVEDVLEFLEYCFNWQDILVTHKVLKNVILRQCEDAVAGISSMAAEFSRWFPNIESSIEQWVSIPRVTVTPGALMRPNPTHPTVNSAPANLGMHHLTGSLAVASSRDQVLPAPLEGIFDSLLELVEAEGERLCEAALSIRTKIIDEFYDLSVTELFERLAAILTTTLLKCIESVALAMCECFAKLVQGLIATLSAEIDVPVLSWLYREVAHEELTFLDAFCLVAAIPATIVYKAASPRGLAPFARGDLLTEQMINARTFAEIRGAVAYAPRVLLQLSTAESTDTSSERQKIWDLVTSIVGLYGGFVVASSNLLVRNCPTEVPYPRVIAAITAVANAGYELPFITFGNAAPDNFGNALVGCDLICGLVCIPIAGHPILEMVESGCETVINLLWLAQLVWSVVASREDGVDIPPVCAYAASSLAGVLALPAEVAKEPKVKLALCLTQFVLTEGASWVLLTQACLDYGRRGSVSDG